MCGPPTMCYLDPQRVMTRVWFARLVLSKRTASQLPLTFIVAEPLWRNVVEYNFAFWSRAFSTP